MGSQRSSRRRKAASGGRLAAVGGLSVVGVAAVVLTVSGPKAPPEYRSRSDAVVPAVGTTATPAPAGSGGVTASAEPSSARTFAGATTAVVLGDGLSATPSTAGSFACAAVVQRGWQCRNFAAAGAGYLSSGTGRSYLDQLEAAASTDDVGLVLVSGGVDRRAAEGAVGGAVQELVAQAAYTFPGATIVLVSPFDTGSGVGPGGAAVRQALRSAADGRDVRFVDASAWFGAVPAALAGDGRALSAKASSVAVQRLSSVIPAAVGGA